MKDKGIFTTTERHTKIDSLKLTDKIAKTLIKMVLSRISRAYVVYLEGNKGQNRNVNIFK
jgi:hypothetical protein